MSTLTEKIVYWVCVVLVWCVPCTFIGYAIYGTWYNTHYTPRWWLFSLIIPMIILIIFVEEVKNNGFKRMKHHAVLLRDKLRNRSC